MKKKTAYLKHAWLITLMDLMLLMLTFFIMLYSMSSPKKKSPSMIFPAVISSPVATLQRGVHLNYLEQILSQQTSAFENYKITKEGNSLYVQIPSSIFAQTQNRLLLSEEENKLKLLGEILNNISNEMLLQVSSETSDIQEALLLASVIANKLKEGGYLKNLRIIFQKSNKNDFAQIVIFEHIGEE